MNSRVIVACLALAAVASADELKPLLPPEQAAGYTLTWHDEFDGDKLNTEEWSYRTGERFASNSLAANISVQDGNLRVALKKEKSGKVDYTAGGVISKREFKHGYYEARFRVPPKAGWHTSFWMMKNTPGQTGNRQEIDVCEQDSKDLTSFGINLHLHKPEHKVLAGRRLKTPDLSEGFHVFGCEFSSREIRTYFDGKLAGVADATGFQHDTQSIWLSVVGWANLPWNPKEKIDDTGLPGFAMYDYVRFFEKPSLENESAPKQRSIVVFGDSITAGGALPAVDHDKAWVRVVERESNGQLRVINEGKGGKPSASTKEFDVMLSRQPRADVMVLALGTNDSRDITPACVPKAVQNLRYMAERTRQTFGPNARVLIVGPPNLNKAALVATKGIANEREAKIRELGEGFAKLAAELKCEYVSLFGAVPEESMTKDGVHPDPKGNAAIAKVLLPALLKGQQ